MESGYHGEWWFELDRLFDQPERLRPYVAELGGRLAVHRIEAVCGPMRGGARLAEMIGAELRLDAFSAERIEPAAARGLFPVKYRLPGGVRDRVRGKSVAVVDDAISAGSAVRGTVADLRECGARPLVLGALFIFGSAAARFAADHGLALEGICAQEFALWPPGECPLCQAGVAVERISDGG